MKRNLVIAAITAAALIGGGTYTAVAMGGDGTAGPAAAPSVPVSQPGSPDVSPSSDVSPSPDDSPRPQVSRADLTAGQAVDAALKKIPGRVVSVERDDDRGGRWEVDLLGDDNRRHELKVGGDGTVRPDDRDHDDDDRDDRAALRGATVDARQAADAALAAVPGSVTSVEIDDDRTGHWEVDVRGADGRTHELNVHARTGKVTPDRDDDHGGDDHGGRHGDDRDDDGQDG
ncbi:PepSY domain-containing protein [Streptomyces sp. NPDC050804]|uniref:PepSY domain-containing protein n=1 Tax=Streptomyces sp. NPDC050804 TaxID=3154745 RepID=UPI00343215E7